MCGKKNALEPLPPSIAFPMGYSMQPRLGCIGTHNDITMTSHGNLRSVLTTLTLHLEVSTFVSYSSC